MNTIDNQKIHPLQVSNLTKQSEKKEGETYWNAMHEGLGHEVKATPVMNQLAVSAASQIGPGVDTEKIDGALAIANATGVSPSWAFDHYDAIKDSMFGSNVPQGKSAPQAITDSFLMGRLDLSLTPLYYEYNSYALGQKHANVDDYPGMTQEEADIAKAQEIKKQIQEKESQIAKLSDPQQRDWLASSLEALGNTFVPTMTQAVGGSIIGAGLGALAGFALGPVGWALDVGTVIALNSLAGAASIFAYSAPKSIYNLLNQTYTTKDGRTVKLPVDKKKAFWLGTFAAAFTAATESELGYVGTAQRGMSGMFSTGLYRMMALNGVSTLGAVGLNLLGDMAGNISQDVMEDLNDHIVENIYATSQGYSPINSGKEIWKSLGETAKQSGMASFWFGAFNIPDSVKVAKDVKAMKPLAMESKDFNEYFASDFVRKSQPTSMSYDEYRDVQSAMYDVWKNRYKVATDTNQAMPSTASKSAENGTKASQDSQASQSIRQTEQSQQQVGRNIVTAEKEVDAGNVVLPDIDNSPDTDTETSDDVAEPAWQEVGASAYKPAPTVNSTETSVKISDSANAVDENSGKEAEAVKYYIENNAYNSDATDNHTRSEEGNHALAHVTDATTPLASGNDDIVDRHIVEFYDETDNGGSGEVNTYGSVTYSQYPNGTIVIDPDGIQLAKGISSDTELMKKTIREMVNTIAMDNNRHDVYWNTQESLPLTKVKEGIFGTGDGSYGVNVGLKGDQAVQNSARILKTFPQMSKNEAGVAGYVLDMVRNATGVDMNTIIDAYKPYDGTYPSYASQKQMELMSRSRGFTIDRAMQEDIADTTHALVYATGKGDMSTFIHESAHLADSFGIVKRVELNKAFFLDAKSGALAKWIDSVGKVFPFETSKVYQEYGIKNGTDLADYLSDFFGNGVERKWNGVVDEAFANSMEAYYATRSNSPAKTHGRQAMPERIMHALKKIADVMKGIYDNLVGVNAEVPENLRAVLDSYIAGNKTPNIKMDISTKNTASMAGATSNVNLDKNNKLGKKSKRKLKALDDQTPINTQAETTINAPTDTLVRKQEETKDAVKSKIEATIGKNEEYVANGEETGIKSDVYAYNARKAADKLLGLHFQDAVDIVKDATDEGSVAGVQDALMELGMWKGDSYNVSYQPVTPNSMDSPVVIAMEDLVHVKAISEATGHYGVWIGDGDFGQSGTISWDGIAKSPQEAITKAQEFFLKQKMPFVEKAGRDTQLVLSDMNTVYALGKVAELQYELKEFKEKAKADQHALSLLNRLRNALSRIVSFKPRSKEVHWAYRNMYYMVTSAIDLDYINHLTDQHGMVKQWDADMQKASYDEYRNSKTPMFDGNGGYARSSDGSIQMVNVADLIKRMYLESNSLKRDMNEKTFEMFDHALQTHVSEWTAPDAEAVAKVLNFVLKQGRSLLDKAQLSRREQNVEIAHDIEENARSMFGDKAGVSISDAMFQKRKNSVSNYLKRASLSVKNIFTIADMVEPQKDGPIHQMVKSYTVSKSMELQLNNERVGGIKKLIDSMEKEHRLKQDDVARQVFIDYGNGKTVRNFNEGMPDRTTNGINLSIAQLMGVYAAAEGKNPLVIDAIKYGVLMSNDDKLAVATEVDNGNTKTLAFITDKESNGKGDISQSQAEFERVANERWNAVKAAAEKAINDDGRLKPIIDYINGDFKKYFGTVNEVTRRVYNIDMYNDPNYFPIQRLFWMYGGDEEQSLLQQLNDGAYMNRLANIERGFTVDKQKVSQLRQTPIELDLMKLFVSHVEDVDHMIAFSDWAMTYRGLFEGAGSMEVRNVFEKYYGDATYSYLKDWVMDAINPDTAKAKRPMDHMIAILRGKLPYAVLAFNTSPMVTQIVTSWEPFIQVLGTKGMARYVANIPNLWKKKYRIPVLDDTGRQLVLNGDPQYEMVDGYHYVQSLSSIMRNREMNLDTAAWHILQHQKVYYGEGAGGALGKVAKVSDKVVNDYGMLPLTAIDLVEVYTGWLTLYETKLDELQKNGSTDFADMQEKAIQYADVETARVQPSGDKAFTSPLYKKFGNIGGIITMFTSSLNVAFNNVLQANAGLVNAFRKEGGGFVSPLSKDKNYLLDDATRKTLLKRFVLTLAEFAITGVALGLVKQGFDDDDDDEEKRKKVGYWMISQGIDTIPIFGNTLDDMVWSWFTGATWNPLKSTAIHAFPGPEQIIKGVYKLASGKGAEKYTTTGAFYLMQGLGSMFGLPMTETKKVIDLIGEPKIDWSTIYDFLTGHHSGNAKFGARQQ